MSLRVLRNHSLLRAEPAESFISLGEKHSILTNFSLDIILILLYIYNRVCKTMKVYKECK